MSDSERYNFNSYMSSGASWERSAESCEWQKDFLTAKSRYFDAMFAYEKAYNIARAADDYAEREAYSKMEYCRRQASEMAYKYDDAVRRNLSM